MARVVAIVGVLVFAFVAVGAVATQYESTVEESQNTTIIANETFTVQTGAINTFVESNRDVVYNDTVTVRQNGTEIEESGNFTWLAHNGTMRVPPNNETQLAGGQSANITYRFTEPSNEQRAVRDVALVPLELVEGLVLIAAAALLLTGLAILGRQR